MGSKKILMILSLLLMMSIALFSMGIAYAGRVRGTGLWGVCFLLTFGFVAVLAQLIPAGILVSSFIGGAFSSFRKSGVPRVA